MNIFTVIGVAVVIIVVACFIMNNYFHKKYATMVSQAQADVISGQKTVTQAVIDVQAAAAAVKAAVKS